MSQARQIRHRFYKGLLTGLNVVWPLFSLLLGVIVVLGLLVSHFEGWGLLEGIYFAFVTGLTVGYGDLVPKQHISRILAVGIGFTGILLTAIFAAISVHALEVAVRETPPPPPQSLPE